MSLEKEMALHTSILAWKSHGQKSQVGYSPWGCKELDMTEMTNAQEARLDEEGLLLSIFQSSKDLSGTQTRKTIRITEGAL